MKLEVVNQARKKISPSFIKKVLQETLFLSDRKIEQISLSVVFVSKKRIQELNRIYRKKNEPTDVLSFNYSSGYNKKGIRGLPAEALPVRQAGSVKAGEIILCPEVIEKSAKERGVSFQKELAFVLSHGILHLLGMRHGRKMYEMQNKILNLKFVCG